MGFVPNSLIPENGDKLEYKYYTSKKKIYPDGSWSVVHSLGALFPDKEYNDYARKVNAGIADLDDFEEIKSCSSDDYILPSEFKEKSMEHTIKCCSNDVEHSLHRAKSKIFDLVMCNAWNYFFTGTFQEDDLRHDKKKVLQKMRKWLNNNVERKGLSYLLVAEYSPLNKNIHFHGLFNDCGLTFLDSGTYICDRFKKPVKLKTLQNLGISPDTCKKVFNIKEWQDSFGFCTAIPLFGNKVALARYITKYITKDNDKIFGKYYWSSKNIVREPEIVLFDISDDYFWNELPSDTFYIPMCELPLKYDCSFRTRNMDPDYLLSQVPF